MSDDKSVLGNLPRSRPGTRSDKRRKARPADAAEAAARASEQEPPAAKPKPKPRAAAKPKAAAKPPHPPKPVEEPVPDPGAPEPVASDPLGDVARTAAKAVGTGVKIGTGLAQEVLRRLPRP
jgi:hypothetical protein